MVEQERIAAYLFSLEKDMPAFLEELEKQAIKDHVPIIRKSTQAILRFLMASFQPENILEVGTAVGFSGIFMMTYLLNDKKKYSKNNSENDKKKLHLTTIEKVPERIRQAKENFKKAELSEYITLLEGEAEEILQNLLKQKEEKIDFIPKEGYSMIFMDAAKGQYLHFLPTVKQLLKKGGLLVSDNVLQDGTIIESRYSITRRDRTIHERMREYLYQLSHDTDFETVTLPMGDGVTLSYKYVN